MLIYISGYWNDDRSPLDRLAQIGLDVDEGLDDSIFYYFEPDEPIVGNHSDFTVTHYEAA